MRCPTTSDDMKNGKNDASRILAATAKTRGAVQSLKQFAGMCMENDEQKQTSWALNKISSLLSGKSLKKYLSFLGESCGKYSPVTENSDSMFTFDVLQNLQLEVWKLLKSYSICVFLSSTVNSRSFEISRKQKSLSSLQTSLLGACDGIPVHVEEQCSLPGLHVSFCSEEKDA